MLPTTFLRQLIGFYGGSLQGVVPKYLEQAMATFAQGQQQMRTVMEKSFPFLPPPMEEMGRQNLAFIERAMTMFNPFAHTGPSRPDAPRPAAGNTDAPPHRGWPRPARRGPTRRPPRPPGHAARDREPPRPARHRPRRGRHPRAHLARHAG